MSRWFPFRRTDAPETIEPQRAYAMWAASYPPWPHNPLMEIEQQSVLSLLPDLTGLTVLDAGCGTGRYLRELDALGARPVGIDLSSAMLARARAITSRIARADICALPFDSMSVDAIVCGLALGDVASLEPAIAEMARVIRPGGCAVYSVVHPVGAKAGWSRTFDVGARRVAVNGYWHSANRHRQACRGAGLRITAWMEPVLRDAPDHPAVLVVRASR